MKVTEALNQTKETVLYFENLSPLKGRGVDSLYHIIDPLMEFKPKFSR